ncbi:MAG: hypothetical protein ABEH40_09810 [Haloferacaceae archaeon]
MPAPTEFADAVDPYLRDDERVVTGAVLEGGWLALTPDRCLVYAADEERLRAVERAGITGLDRTVRADGGDPRRAVRLGVYGLLAVAVGRAADRVNASLAVDLSGTAGAPGMGSLLAVIGLVRQGLSTVGLIGPAVGALLCLAAVALGLRWYRSRRPALVVETTDGPLRLPGTADEVDALLTDLRGALGDRPDPGTLLE